MSEARRVSAGHRPLRRPVALGVLATLSAILASCAHARTGATVAPEVAEVADDSIVGTVAVVAAAPDEHVVIRTPAGVRRLVATHGSDSVALSRLSAVEIVARGRAEADRFVASSFLVRRVDGQPVVDGVLRSSNGRLFIDTADGSREVGHPPRALLALIGSRVWLGGSLEAGPTSFGVIIPVRRGSAPP
jgi:hypothetical protein